MSPNFVVTTVLQIGMHGGLAQGMLTAEELAQHHGVSAQTIWRWFRQGRIAGMCYNDRGSCLFPPLQEEQQLPTALK